MSIMAWIWCSLVSGFVLALIVALFGAPPEPIPETPEERRERIDRAVAALSRDMGLQDIETVKRRMEAHQERQSVITDTIMMEVGIDERYRRN